LLKVNAVAVEVVPRRFHVLPYILLAIVLLLATTACGTTTVPTVVAPAEPPAAEEQPPQAPSEPTVPAEAGRGFSLTGDANFSEGKLTDQQRVWYDRTWAAVGPSTQAILNRIRGDNSYHFGRDVYQYNHALLMSLRSTGDLRFLDEVAKVSEALRRQLEDEWCGGVPRRVDLNERYGTVKSPDGFLNFRRQSNNSVDDCRDVSDLEEALIHGHLSLLMYAFHVNQNNPSPSNVDYRGHAEFWFDYLRNHFEAKWRERSETAWPSMDFIDLKFCHTYSQFSLYYYFMGMKLQDEGSADADPYLKAARALTDGMFDQAYRPDRQAGGYVEVTGPTGDAVIYSFGAPGRGSVSDTHLEACPTTYARYKLSTVMTLRLEGFTRWNDAIMTKLANGMTGFVLDIDSIDDGSETIAAGVSGTAKRAGMPPTSYRGRLRISQFGVTSMPAYAIWDVSGRIEELSLEAYMVLEDKPDRPSNVHLPSSMLFLESATRRGLGVTTSR
jgi:hypothetical protein